MSNVNRKKMTLKKYKYLFIPVCFLLVLFISITSVKLVNSHKESNLDEGELFGAIVDNTLKINFSRSKVYLANNEEKTLTFTLKRGDALVSPNSVTVNVSSSNNNIVTAWHANGSIIRFKGKNNDRSTRIKTAKITISVGNVSDTVEVVVYNGDWTNPSNGGFDVKVSNTGFKSTMFTKSGCYALVDGVECTKKKKDGVEYYNCPKYYNRCLGSAPASEESACYINIQTNEYEWGKFATKSGYAKMEGLEEKECKKPNLCDTTIKQPNKNETANSCYGDKKVVLNTGMGCTSAANDQYYNISCSPENVIVEFNPDDNLANSSLSSGALPLFYPGQGLAYNIQVTSTRRCEGDFKIENWKNAYKTVITSVRTFFERMNNNKYSENDKKTYKSSYNEYLNKLKKLLNMVIEYNKYTNELKNYEMSPVATMEIYQTKNENGVITEKKVIANPSFDDFTITENGSGKLITHKTYSLGIDKKELEKYGISTDGLSNPIHFTYNMENPKRGEFNLKKSYINKITGEVSNNDYAGNSNWIDAGNKYYTNLNLSSKYNYGIKINITNLGATKNLTVTNEECGFTIKENNNLIYRHVDPVNPFISNSDREIGRNWLNSNYDFSKVIKPSTAVLYKFNISKAEVKEIKKSNSLISGSNEYLGVCNNNLYNDDIVCKILKGNDD